MPEQPTARAVRDLSDDALLSRYTNTERGLGMSDAQEVQTAGMRERARRFEAEQEELRAEILRRMDTAAPVLPASAVPAVGRHAFGEPWRAGKFLGEIVSDTFASGQTLQEHLLAVRGAATESEMLLAERSGGALVAESMETSRRDRAIACVNALAGLAILADAPVGWLAQRLARLDRLEHMVEFLNDWWSGHEAGGILLAPDEPEDAVHTRCFRTILAGDATEMLVVGVEEHLSDALLAYAEGSETVPAPSSDWLRREP